METLQKMLAQLSGKIPPALLQRIRDAENDPEKLVPLLRELTELMGNPAEAPLDIGSFYREGDGSPYTLVWPLAGDNPLVTQGIPFEALDRKTQFFTLFAEWSRREADGLVALNGGELELAQSVFEECVERADQIEVGELRARSFENLARVAERRSDQSAVVGWLQKAKNARARP